MSNILSIIAAKGYQDKEYGDSRTVLEQHGHTVATASTTEVAHGKFGGSVEADLLLTDVDPEDYDAIVFIGGPGCYQYYNDPIALDLARKFFESGKVTAAICSGPGILANAGVLKGKKATCWDGEAERLKKSGATYTGEGVERDGIIVTGAGPADAADFGELIHEALVKNQNI